ncbi:putative flavoprotein involved in K+ transport [Kribbella amoyensis]|uniref:Putative flavoprotein involved in K+ transport n=1 Tax=Kribbella amoyensis TaxID=996641 RepID=A0A561BW14_9ACTN|nr:NAD(P)/FAD-dependent oxidoreductase [Kribbella amoyensis]TWD83028.1 putative flavoprotein involved in K+ transport [Kribbella amoyensis]
MNDGRTEEQLEPAEADRVEVVVVGAGQAGLAIGYFLARQGRRFLILEAADSVGAAWRDRWDSLALFTPRRYDALPGLAFPGEPDGYPNRDEVVSYLTTYAETFKLPVVLNTAVRSLTQIDDGFELNCVGRRVRADQVVVATGPFQLPSTPALAGQLGPEVVQLHSTGYRQPGNLPAGTVLVVGGGNTGFQIATELAGTHAVHLSVGSRQTPLPQKIGRRDLFWWLTKTRLLTLTVDSRLGRRLSKRETLIGSSPKQLRRLGVELHPRAVSASNDTVNFADGTHLRVDAVVWATGYQPDRSWIDPSVLDAAGRVRHHRGVTSLPGFYFLGLYWQHTRGSALLGWVKDDAEYLAARIQILADSREPPRETNTQATADQEEASHVEPQ